MRALLAAALAALCLPGCFLARVQDNEPLDPARLASLEPGVTRAAEAVALLGAPAQVVNLEGRSAYRYEHARSKRAGLFLLVVGFFNDDTRTDRAWLFFDQRDVLTHYGATFEAGGAAYAMPWVDVHEEEDDGASENAGESVSEPASEEAAVPAPGAEPPTEFTGGAR